MGSRSNRRPKLGPGYKTSSIELDGAANLSRRYTDVGAWVLVLASGAPRVIEGDDRLLRHVADASGWHAWTLASSPWS